MNDKAPEFWIEKREMPDCKKCSYRILLAKIADIQVWKEDCDLYGTDRCKQINEPVFIVPQDVEIDFDYEAEDV